MQGSRGTTRVVAAGWGMQVGELGWGGVTPLPSNGLVLFQKGVLQP